MTDLVRPTEAGATGLLSATHDGPLGPYLIVSSAAGVVYLAPLEQRRPRWLTREGPGHSQHNITLARELDEYFAGRRQRFSVPLDLRGTEFQRQVWMGLEKIAYGETLSYHDLAAAIGRPASARAVGRAVASNPVSIVVPCHRVIGSNGDLTGYAGGLQRKRALLALEARHRGGPQG